MCVVHCAAAEKFNNNIQQERTKAAGFINCKNKTNPSPNLQYSFPHCPLRIHDAVGHAQVGGS
jgi:hypothetical protein